jgi:DNA-binding transcriptional MocR family regulator
MADVTALIPGWRDGPGSLKGRLAHALRDAIERGDLAPGARLPPERALAKRLGISRTTVMGTYDLLRQEERIQSRQGSGTVVAAVRKEAAGYRDQLVAQLARNPIFRGLLDSPATTIDFSTAAPAAAPAVTPAIRSALADLDAFTRGPGYFPAGLPPLREAIAAHLSRRGVATSADEVLVTSGGQQAISLLVTLYVEPGELVVVEKPTYPGALDAMRSAGAKLLAVPVGERGVRPSDLRQVLGSSRARVVYLTPSFNNPTGSLVPPRARRELAKVVGEFQATLIEDQSLADTALDDAEPLTPVAGFAQGAAVATIGSLSKLFWGGLRVGWVRAPKPVIVRLARVKAVADLASSLLPQLVALQLLPLADEVRAQRRDELGVRLDRLTSLLTDLLPSWTWSRPGGGLSLWARLPAGDAVEFADLALRHGVAIVPGPHFCPDDGCRDCLRIAFCLDPARLESGVRRLTLAWSEYAAITAQMIPTMHRAIV